MIRLTLDLGTPGKFPIWIAVNSIAAVAPGRPPWPTCIELHGGQSYGVLEPQAEVMQKIQDEQAITAQDIHETDFPRRPAER